MIEICLREVDADGVTTWEAVVAHNGHHVWSYPEYREAAFAQAGRLLGEKYEKHLKGTDND